MGAFSRVIFILGAVCVYSAQAITQTEKTTKDVTAAQFLWALSGAAVQAKRNEYNLRFNRSSSNTNAIDNDARNNPNYNEYDPNTNNVDVNYRQNYYQSQKYPYKQQGQGQYYQQQNYQQGNQNPGFGSANNYPNNYPNKYPQQFQQGFRPPGPFGPGNFPPQGPGPYSPLGGPGPFPNFERPPPPLSVMDALGSIAENDDLHCVPRLLCEITSGANPGGRQSPSFIPSFINMDSLLGILTAFDGAQANPILMFGRAALLGYNSKGNARSCQYAYPKCPQDADRLVTYLNNHNGGFFRYFSGINPNQQNPAFGFPPNFGGNQPFPGYPPNRGFPPNLEYPPNAGYPPNLGYPPNQGYPQYPEYPQRPDYQQRPDYSQNSQTYPQNLGYYQKPNYQQNQAYPSQKPSNSQKPNYQQNQAYPSQKPSYSQKPNYQQNQAYPSQNPSYSQSYVPPNTNYGYVPNAGSHQNGIYSQKPQYQYPQRPQSQQFNQYANGFPASSNPIKYPSNYQQKAAAQQRIQTKPGPILATPHTVNKYRSNQYAWRFPVPDENDYNNIDNDNFLYNRKRNPKALAFPETQRDAASTTALFYNQKQIVEFPKPLPNQNLIPMIFPDRTGTGDLLLDADKSFFATEDAGRPHSEHVFYLKHFRENNRTPDLNLSGNNRETKSLRFPFLKEGRTYND